MGEGWLQSVNCGGLLIKKTCYSVGLLKNYLLYWSSFESASPGHGADWPGLLTENGGRFFQFSFS